MCEPGDGQHAHGHMDLIYVCRMKCLLLVQCSITDVETILGGCETHSRSVMCFSILLWFSRWVCALSKVRCKMQG